MDTSQGWNPMGSARAAAVWCAGVAAGAIGVALLWRRRADMQRRGYSYASGAADRVTSVLNDLIETCTDAEQGFETAANGIKDPDIRSLFVQYSRQRRDFRTELERLVRINGGTPSTTGSTSGKLHHAWMNIKSTVTNGDEGAIIAEAERGEDVGVRAYEQALRAALPAGVRDVVHRQFAQVKAAHDRVRDLERTHTRA